MLLSTSPGSLADTHSYANPTLHPTEDGGQEEPSVQIPVTPSHFDELFSYDAWHRTCDSLFAPCFRGHRFTRQSHLDLLAQVFHLPEAT